MDPITIAVLALAGIAVAVTLADALLRAGTAELPAVQRFLGSAFRQVKRAIALGFTALRGAEIFSTFWNLLAGAFNWVHTGFAMLLHFGQEWLVQKLNLNPTSDQLKELREKQAVQRELAL
jgi:hypothetical protein